MSELQVEIPQEPLERLAERWKISELAVFGSAARPDFGPGSDLDLLVTFRPDAEWSLWEFIDLKEDLEQLFARRVDLIEKRALRNPYRRAQILGSARVVYAA
jgi:uncharacterized protein